MKQSSSTHRSEGKNHSKIRQVGLVGAGVMGREIAVAILTAGLPVILCERTPSLAMTAIEEIKRTATSRGLQGPHFVKSALQPPISFASGSEEFAEADLIIEAVPEAEDLKIAILKDLEPYLRAETILASNSSSIPITRLASALKNPHRLCGMHFCHPVSERPLVELIRGEKTALETLNRVDQFVRNLNLFPVRLEDRPGFLLNRLLVPYLTESLELLLEGVPPESLELAALDFGMPMSPLHHLDEFGIDVALGVGKTLYRAFPDRIVPSELLIAMYKAGWYGCKGGAGFFASNEANSTTLRPEVLHLIRSRQRTPLSHSHDEISLRLFLPLLLEAMRAWEDAVVDDPALIDEVLRKGLGMTPRFPGLWTWANSLGSRQILRWLESHRELGKRFEATPTLQCLGAKNASLPR